MVPAEQLEIFFSIIACQADRRGTYGSVKTSRQDRHLHRWLERPRSAWAKAAVMEEPGPEEPGCQFAEPDDVPGRFIHKGVLYIFVFEE